MGFSNEGFFTGKIASSTRFVEAASQIPDVASQSCLNEKENIQTSAPDGPILGNHSYLYALA
jgi:hypothetical protein